MPSSDSIVAVLEAFRSEFTEPTWTKVLVLLWGTILARGRRTVTAALRQMGLDYSSNFNKHYHIFNIFVWSPLRLARGLTRSLVRTFLPSDLRLTLIIDETLERRWGRRRICIRGHYRDPLASSKVHSVAASGFRWIVLALSVTPPWTTQPWALPILSLPSPTPTVSAQLGRRHKTIADWARQMIRCVRRWLPEADLTVVGDQAYSVIELGLGCRRHGVRLIAPLRLDARLFAPPPPHPARTLGRPRIVGGRLPNLEVVLTDPTTVWEAVELRWYDGAERTLEVATGTALWYHSGQEPLPIRWVISRDPQGELEPRGSSSTCPEDTATAILAEFIRRWSIETTFEESRAHLGIETQRQWSDLAIARETPCRFGLYSLVAVLGRALHQEHPIAIRAAAWYPKPLATFSDVLAAVRRHGWDWLDIRTSHRDPTCVEIPGTHFNCLLNAVCYSH
jgi:hypothetical protein